MKSTQFEEPAAQLKMLLKGVVDVHVEDELKKKLERCFATQKPLLIKAGFDPTAPDLHLGHLVLLTKLRHFQDLGHSVIFLIGDYTARIGDPTGKNVTRPALTESDVKKNAETYERQVFRVLNKEKTIIRMNSEWLSPMSFEDVIRLAAKCSVARLIERDDFKKRLKEGRPISVHELLYPMMQAYDSVVLKPDVELGGRDQLFNLLMGRELMHKWGQEPQCIITVPILEGIEAREENGVIVGDKMSKSLGNFIGLAEDPDTQFGKLMSISDPLMWRYYELISLKSQTEIDALKSGHPRDTKVALACEIVSRFHSEDAAQQALLRFKTLFGAEKRNSIPDDAPELRIDLTGNSAVELMDALVASKLIESNADAKRLIRQGAVHVDGERIVEIKHPLSKGTHQVRVGKTKWAKLIIA
jgi:tyrosyl-tRNA synthetase